MMAGDQLGTNSVVQNTACLPHWLTHLLSGCFLV
jgi:hypothetical protein